MAGVVAKMRMIRWMKLFNGMLVKNNVTTYMNNIYVDDQSWAVRALKKGVRWDRGTGVLRWSSEWEGEDSMRGEPDDKRTF